MTICRTRQIQKQRYQKGKGKKERARGRNKLTQEKLNVIELKKNP